MCKHISGQDNVINQKGIITYAFLNEDYTLRAEPTDVLAALESEQH